MNRNPCETCFKNHERKRGAEVAPNLQPFGKEPKVGFTQEPGIGRRSFAGSSLRGKMGGDSTHAEPHCGTSCTTKFRTNSFVFKNEIERKDFQEIARLAWAQEVPSSNLGAPTIHAFCFPSLIDHCFLATGLVNFSEAGGRFLQAIQFPQLRCTVSRQKLKKTGVPFRKY
jgi:hypothetical protein